MIKHLLISIFCLHSFFLFSQQDFLLQGTIFDSDKKALAYAGIVVDSFASGTLSDEKGNYQLRLTAGKHILWVQNMGYSSIYDTLLINKDIRKDFYLKNEDLSIEDVIITANGRDPAYGMIQKAIERKGQNANPFPTYQYQAYTKTVMALPEKIGAGDINLDLSLFNLGKKKKKDDKGIANEQELMMKTKILFLSETVSDVFIQVPNKVRENIVSSRISGDSEQFSMFGNLGTSVDMYKDRIVIEGIADRGIISPIADNAMFYYDYKLMGVGNERGVKYYKINILPKRERDPIFFGTIYLTDSSYAIKEIDVHTSKAQQLETVDTLKFHQQYAQIQQKWLPIHTRMGFDLNFDFGGLKLPITGAFTSVLSDFNVTPNFKKNTFNAEIVTVSDSSIKRNYNYWEHTRPIPLTPREALDFRIKDSLESVRKSPSYMDSLQKVANKINFGKWLSAGQELNFHRQQIKVKLSPLIQHLGFNPMEGLFILPEANVTKKWKQNARELSLNPVMRYGFLSKKFSYQLGIKYLTNPKRAEMIHLKGGDYVFQFSPFQQIDPYLSMMATLSYGFNRIRIYQQKYAEIGYQRELFNGFKAEIETGYYHRTGINENKTQYSWKKNHGQYEENIAGNGENPLFPTLNRLPNFQLNRAFISTLQISYRPGTKYISLPNKRIDLGSDFPLFTLRYTKAVPLQTGFADFDKMMLTINDATALGMLGTMNWRVTGGVFLNERKVFFPDLFHYKGNETYFHGGNTDAFFVMPYYLYSGTKPYVEAHVEQAFHRFLLNKIPLVRKLGLNEYVGLHGLWQQNTDPYLELNIGLEKKILKILPIRVDFNLCLLGSPYRRMSYKIITPDASMFVAQ
ncbi:MAG: DUF5686 family protein [Bacteroidia bacterium]